MNLIPSAAQRRRWFEIVISGLIIPTYLQFFRRRRLICFTSNLHITGFSSRRITTMFHSYLMWFLWWLRHGAIGPIEATLFRVNVDWIDFRIYTFELVIRLSKVKQLALLLCAFFTKSRRSCRPHLPRQLPLFQREVALNNQKHNFFHRCSSSLWHSWHDMNDRQAHAFQVCFFLLMVVWWGETNCAPNSMELESRLCQLGQDLTTVPERE